MHRPVVVFRTRVWDERDAMARIVNCLTGHRVVVVADEIGEVPPGPAVDLEVRRAATAGLARLLRRERPTVLHDHAAGDDGLAAALGIPRLTTSPDDVAEPVDLREHRPLATRSSDDLLGLLRREVGAMAADLDASYRAVAAGDTPTRRSGPDRLPRVAVVVASRDRAELLARALDHLAAQDWPTDLLSVVAINDQASDGTRELLDARAADGSIVALHNEVNLGAGASRDRGIDATDSDIVAFTDDDCMPDPTWIAALVAGFRDEVDLVQGRTGPDPAQPLGPLSRTQWTPAEYGLYETANMAYRRELLERLGPRPFGDGIQGDFTRLLGPRFGVPAFGEDTWLAWRARRDGAVTAFASQAVVLHHVFQDDPRLLLRRSIHAAGFPPLVRRLPELREVVLWNRVFLTPGHALLYLAGAGVVAAVPLHPATLVATLPYAWSLLRPRRPGLRARLRLAPVLALRDVVETAVMAYASLRSRSLVL